MVGELLALRVIVIVWVVVSIIGLQQIGTHSLIASFHQNKLGSATVDG